jgi:hypothetical protein
MVGKIFPLLNCVSRIVSRDRLLRAKIVEKIIADSSLTFSDGIAPTERIKNSIVRPLKILFIEQIVCFYPFR